MQLQKKTTSQGNLIEQFESPQILQHPDLI